MSDKLKTILTNYLNVFAHTQGNEAAWNETHRVLKDPALVAQAVREMAAVNVDKMFGKLPANARKCDIKRRERNISYQTKAWLTQLARPWGMSPNLPKTSAPTKPPAEKSEADLIAQAEREWNSLRLNQSDAGAKAKFIARRVKHLKS